MTRSSDMISPKRGRVPDDLITDDRKPWYLLHVHYRPHGAGPYCDAMSEALKDGGDDDLMRVRTVTDVSKVSCPRCKTAIRRAIR